MRKFLRRVVRLLLFVVPVALGLGVIGYALQNREGPQRLPPEERTTPVRVVTAPAVDVVPRALGYGSVIPGRIWEAVGEVSGTVIYRHPELEKGAVLRAGTQLLRIDPTDYRLAVAQIEANIRSTEAQLAVLDVRASNTKRSLSIEARSIDLSRKELERTQRLVKQGTISQAAADQEERAVLAGEQAIQNLRNSMNLLPAERSVLEATLDQLRAQLETARRNLDRTTIVAPFDCRIAEVNVEKAQFAAQGKVLVVADSLDVAEGHRPGTDRHPSHASAPRPGPPTRSRRDHAAPSRGGGPRRDRASSHRARGDRVAGALLPDERYRGPPHPNRRGHRRG